MCAQATLLMNDRALGLTHMQFGTFMSAVTVPNLILPFLGMFLHSPRALPFDDFSMSSQSHELMSMNRRNVSRFAW
jgi:hypothetical protein